MVAPRTPPAVAPLPTIKSLFFTISGAFCFLIIVFCQLWSKVKVCEFGERKHFPKSESKQFLFKITAIIIIMENNKKTAQAEIQIKETESIKLNHELTEVESELEKETEKYDILLQGREQLVKRIAEEDARISQRSKELEEVIKKSADLEKIK